MFTRSLTAAFAITAVLGLGACSGTGINTRTNDGGIRINDRDIRIDTRTPTGRIRLEFPRTTGPSQREVRKQCQEDARAWGRLETARLKHRQDTGHISRADARLEKAYIREQTRLRRRACNR